MGDNNYKEHPSVSKRVHKDIAYYSLAWSALTLCSRTTIASTVPSLPGLWELYWLENSRRPRILKMGRAWYGGLRSELRVEADGGDPRNISIREYLESGDCYYRYMVCEVAEDLEELYDVISTIRGVPGPSTRPGQRYVDVRVSEPDKMTIHRQRHKKTTQRESFGAHVPNMFDILERMKKNGRK